jgi:hypothetical protein
MLGLNTMVSRSLLIQNRVLGKQKITLKWLSKFELFIFQSIKNEFYFSDLQAMNDDTVDKLYANQCQIDKNQRWLLQEKAGIAPRTLHFGINTVS